MKNLALLTGYIAFGAVQLSAIIAVVGGWWTHILISLHAHDWAFLVFGVIVMPVGVLHGWGHWIGWW
jgi:hypothetical protein